MDTTTSTIEKLQNMFATYGVPSQLVSDNGPRFKSEEFQTFLKRNGIQQLTSLSTIPSCQQWSSRTLCVEFLIGHEK